MKKLILPFVLLSSMLTVCLFAQRSQFLLQEKETNDKIVIPRESTRSKSKQVRKQSTSNSNLEFKKRELPSPMLKSNPSLGMKASSKRKYVKPKNYNEPPATQDDKIIQSAKRKLKYLRTLPMNSDIEGRIIELENFLSSKED